MKNDLRQGLIDIARQKISCDDPSHDFLHAMRVLLQAECIAKREGGDPDVIVPAALFHDIITYPKNNPESNNAQRESATLTGKILQDMEDYPEEKIESVKIAINACSYSKGTISDLLEAQILQDADRLEATGAVSIMRTFSSSGGMKRAFYHSDDPFCEDRETDSLKYGLDLFYDRLLKVKDRMNTRTARHMAETRTKFLENFLEELRTEIGRNQKKSLALVA